MLKDNSPLISVIVPVFNVVSYLDATIKTIIGQTYQNLQIILVDDGSTDGSSMICDEWMGKDPRIQVIHQANRGPSCARNAALDIASGEYILFSDSDDLLSPDLCQILLNTMVPEAGVALCEFCHVFPGQPAQFQKKSEQMLLDAEAVICRMWYQNGVLPSACAKLFRKSIFDYHRFTPGLIFEDIDLLHELFWQAEKIAYTPSVLYGYVHRKESITSRPFSKKDLDILKVVERLLQFSKNKPSLAGAAQAYAVTAALRVYLNAPRTAAFDDGIAAAVHLIRRYGKSVLFDRNTRNKNRCALCLYFLCRPLLHMIYRKINRWK